MFDHFGTRKKVNAVEELTGELYLLKGKFLE